MRLVTGLLRPQLVRSDPDGCRVGLLATTALLLGGDAVGLSVRVGPGATLDLFDVAGTVAYHGRGESASWTTEVTVGEGAVLRYAGEPFVVSDGADVSRSLILEVDGGGRARIRDTVVLGRTGELGGRLRSRTAIGVAGSPVLLEDQDLDPAGDRRLPGMLGPHRILDTVTRVGPEPASREPSGGGAVAYALLGGAGTVTRWLGDDLDRSPFARRRDLLAD